MIRVAQFIGAVAGLVALALFGLTGMAWVNLIFVPGAPAGLAFASIITAFGGIAFTVASVAAFSWASDARDRPRPRRFR